MMRCREFIRRRRNRTSVFCSAPASHEVHEGDGQPTPCCEVHAARLTRRGLDVRPLSAEAIRERGKAGDQ